MTAGAPALVPALLLAFPLGGALPGTVAAPVSSATATSATPATPAITTTTAASAIVTTAATAVAPAAATTTVQDAGCPTSPSTAAGPDFRGKTLAFSNFASRDLTNANFEGATLQGVAFVRANLTGANFRNARFVDSGSAVRTSDFSLATLAHACFAGATFAAVTYFTYATLTCADFSATDLSSGNAVFGDEPLRFDAAACRPAFRNARMNCEFVAQWNRLDLSGANIAACRDALKPGHDFSGAQMVGVVFDGLDLSGSRWDGAVITRASFQEATLDGATGLAGTAGNGKALAQTLFNRASLRNVDFSHARLHGASFSAADLENANLQGALLGADPDASPPVEFAADFTGAHLKNVNLAGADLTGAVLTYASLYSDAVFRVPAATCSTAVQSCPGLVTGGTCGCATAAGADLTRAKFANAYLYGVDFSGGTHLNGTDFSGAVLVASNFDGAVREPDPVRHRPDAPPLLANAHLQGVNFAGVDLADAVLTGAYVDFGTPTNPGNGNQIAMKLPAAVTRFRNRPMPSNGACVVANYGGAPPDGHFSRLPQNLRMTCPDGLQATGCGALTATNPHWKSGTPLAAASPPGFYRQDASFDRADPQNPLCNLATRDRTW